MSGINFLAQRNPAAGAHRRFYLLLAATVAAGLAVVLFLSWHIAGQATRQQQLLDLLRAEHGRLDTAIEAGKSQDEKSAALENQRRHLEALQQQRNEATRLLAELARRMPPQVFLTTLVQQGRSFTLNGSAPSHRHVMQLLEALRDADGAFTHIELQEARSAVNTKPASTDPGRLHDFVITAGHRVVAAR
ncbi:PilN domain-containing protein [Herbaspirillum sp. NPDC101396]|uniref:PilN domain-containing protein n=1 Tax=Herbaspirillum sp. NPDC101396 TaxID=3364005 RepID=UPI003839FB2B